MYYLFMASTVSWPTVSRVSKLPPWVPWPEGDWSLVKTPPAGSRGSLMVLAWVLVTERL